MGGTVQSNKNGSLPGYSVWTRAQAPRAFTSPWQRHYSAKERLRGMQLCMSLAVKAPQLQAFISFLSLVSIACELQDAAAADSTQRARELPAPEWKDTLKSGSKPTCSWDFGSKASFIKRVTSPHLLRILPKLSCGLNPECLTSTSDLQPQETSHFFQCALSHIRSSLKLLCWLCPQQQQTQPKGAELPSNCLHFNFSVPWGLSDQVFSRCGG